MFNFGILILFLAIIPLPFLKPESPEFVVDVIGLVVDILFLFAVFFDVRRQSSLERRRRDSK
jgi:hypothetical protein